MRDNYEDLGTFSDWVEEAWRQQSLYPVAPPGAETQRVVRDLLGFSEDFGTPQEVRVERGWERDGLIGEEVSWSIRYGPRTRPWVLRPAAGSTALPGVVALHGHDGFKFYGKEKIADGPGDPSRAVIELREELYEGRALANELAKAGFVVLNPSCPLLR